MIKYLANMYVDFSDLKNSIQRHITLSLCFVYVFLRVASFLTWGHPLANNVIAAILIISYITIATKKLHIAWFILVAELFLDGGGRFFELGGFILRTWMLGIFGIAWIVHKVHRKDFKLLFPYSKKLLISFILFIAALLFSIVNAFINGHSPLFIFQDTFLYLFIFLLFPALEIRNYNLPYKNIAYAFILSTALFSFVTLSIYTSGIGSIPDIYYHWFRNVATGRITDLGANFFRIVLSEHIFIVPILAILTSYLIQKPKEKILWFLTLCTAFIFATNFSRIYFLALPIALLPLAYKEHIQKWFVACMSVGILILAVFGGTQIIASQGQTAGLELLGIKTSGIVRPSAETSGSIRLAILPEIITLIKQHPIVGSGIGAKVTFVDPRTGIRNTEAKGDWGYFDFGYLEL